MYVRDWIKKQKKERIQERKQYQNKGRRFLKVIGNILLLLLISIIGVCFYLRDSHYSANISNSSIFDEPTKSELLDDSPIFVNQDEFQLILNPKNDYRLTGLVVNRVDHAWFGFPQLADDFSMDLCLITDKNVKNKIFKRKGISFNQDLQNCYQNQNFISNFNENDFYNNHLIFKNDRVKNKAFSVVKGDQVVIDGIIVNIDQEKTNMENHEYGNRLANWAASPIDEKKTIAQNQIIYVENFRIIKRGNPFFYYCFLSGLILIAGIVIIKIVKFIFFRKPSY